LSVADYPCKFCGKQTLKPTAGYKEAINTSFCLLLIANNRPMQIMIHPDVVLINVPIMALWRFLKKEDSLIFLVNEDLCIWLCIKVVFFSVF
jgi:hypothetical protein